MRVILVILLACGLLAQPIAALGGAACQCCAPETRTAAVEAPTAGTGHACCAGGAGERTRDEQPAPQDSDEHDERGSCPMLCCSGVAPVGVVAAPLRGVPEYEPADWADEISESYPDAPSSRLKRPPRATPLA